MKSKAMAVLAAVMMIGIAFGAMSVQTDAATTKDFGDVTVSEEVPTKKLAFTTNEGEFYGYNYTVKFYVAQWDDTKTVDNQEYGAEVGTTTASTAGGTPTYVPGTPKIIPSTGSTFKVSVEYGDKVGTYLMVVERIAPITEQKVALKAEITVNLDMGAANPAYQTYYTATVKDGSVATMTIDAMADVKGGVFYQKLVNPTTPTITVANYNWYAYDLPEGLSMSVSGYVSGIYVGDVAVTEQEAKVVAVSNTATSSATYQGTMKVSCTAYAAPGDLTIEVTDTTDGGTTVIPNATSVVRVENAEMKFTVKVSRGTSTVTSATVNVIAVDDTGKVTKLTETGGTYTASTKGTGAYKVVVTASDGVKEATSSFTLYVLPSYGNVVAQIIPGST